MSIRTCPACNEMVPVNQLGGLETHQKPNSTDFCPGFVAQEQPPGRKVRSDKGQRRPRKKGGESHAGQQARSQAMSFHQTIQELVRRAKHSPSAESDKTAAPSVGPVIAVGQATAGTSTPEGPDVTIVGKEDPTASPVIKAPTARPPTMVYDWSLLSLPRPYDSTTVTQPERKAPMPEPKDWTVEKTAAEGTPSRTIAGKVRAALRASVLVPAAPEVEMILEGGRAAAGDSVTRTVAAGDALIPAIWADELAARTGMPTNETSEPMPEAPKKRRHRAEQYLVLDSTGSLYPTEAEARAAIARLLADPTNEDTYTLCRAHPLGQGQRGVVWTPAGRRRKAQP